MKRNKNKNKELIKKKTTKSYFWILYICFPIIFIFALYYLYIHSNKTNISININNENKVVKETIITDNSNIIPNYDEFIIISKKNKWYPIDPIEKLKSTIIKYGKIYKSPHVNLTIIEINNIEKENEQKIKMIQQEILFLFKILKKSKNKTINLTLLLFNSIESVHNNLYHIIKEKYLSGHKEFLTKSAIEQSTSSWIYFPVQSILKLYLSPQHRHEIEIQSSQPSYNIHNDNRHILLDLNSNEGRGKQTFLQLATRYRLYRLMQVLVSLGVNEDGALDIAVTNGDDLGIVILLYTQQGNLKNMKSIISSLELAKELKYSYLEERINQANLYLSIEKNDINSTTQLPDIRTVISPIRNEFSPIKKISLVNNNNNNNKYQKMFSKKETKLVNSNKIECDIDRIDGNSINANEFFNKYVKTNRPVILTGNMLNNTEINRIFDFNNFFLNYGDKNIMTSNIPYGNLFGFEMSSMSLKEYYSIIMDYENDLLLNLISLSNLELNNELIIISSSNNGNESCTREIISLNMSCHRLEDYISSDNDDNIIKLPQYLFSKGVSIII
jgi:hypothetical protein